MAKKHPQEHVLLFINLTFTLTFLFLGITILNNAMLNIPLLLLPHPVNFEHIITSFLLCKVFCVEQMVRKT